MHTMVSKVIGAHVIAVDVNEGRLADAAGVGAEVTLNPEQVDVFADVRRRTEVGADVVIAAVGDAKVVERYLPLVRAGGVFNIFGGTPKGDTIQVDPRWLERCALDGILDAVERVKTGAALKTIIMFE